MLSAANHVGVKLQVSSPLDNYYQLIIQNHFGVLKIIKHYSIGSIFSDFFSFRCPLSKAYWSHVICKNFRSLKSHLAMIFPRYFSGTVQPI